MVPDQQKGRLSSEKSTKVSQLLGLSVRPPSAERDAKEKEFFLLNKFVRLN